MKKILLIALFLLSLSAAGQAIHNQGVQIKSMSPAAATDTVYVAIDVNGNVRSISKEELQNRLLNVPFDISSAYTTLPEHNHGKGKIASGSVNLDATGLPIGYEIRLLNESALSIPITLEPGQAITLGQSVKSLESGYYAYAEVVDVNTWSVIIPPISAAAPPGSIGGTIGAQYEVAYGSAVSGEIITSPEMTFDGLNLEVGGSVFSSQLIVSAPYTDWRGLKIFDEAGVIPRFDVTTTQYDLTSVSPTTTNGMHSTVLSYQGDLVLGVMEAGREVKVKADPVTQYGIGNRLFNDTRYMLAGSGLLTLVDDTTPQLGGTLDANGFGIDLGHINGINFNEDGTGEYYWIRFNGSVLSIGHSEGSAGGAFAPTVPMNAIQGMAVQQYLNVSGPAHISDLNLDGIPIYADDSAASSLSKGDVYQTATGELRIKL